MLSAKDRRHQMTTFTVLAVVIGFGCAVWLNAPDPGGTRPTLGEVIGAIAGVVVMGSILSILAFEILVRVFGADGRAQ